MNEYHFYLVINSSKRLEFVIHNKMKAVGIAILAVCISASYAADKTGLTDGGKVTDIKSGQPAPWYTCHAQGNYPDPTTCDHYIACTTNLDAIQMPCQKGDGGVRLWYVRDSGPEESKSYCDYPANVECDLGNGPTTPAPPGPPQGTCGENQVVGGACNPLEDCNQCGDCDWFLRCDQTPGKELWEGTWGKHRCAEEREADNSVLVANKLFWNPDTTDAPHGGVCSHLNTLHPDIKDKYTRDPDCKKPCEFFEANCADKYLYRDPDLDAGIWYSDPVEFSCPAETKWDQSAKSCTLCSGDECKVCKT